MPFTTTAKIKVIVQNMQEISVLSTYPNTAPMHWVYSINTVTV
jgi:hypothetical protein